MDFKKLISHIESIDGPIDTPKAQEKAQPIRLDEDTELRVLAGVTPLTESLIAERAKNPYAIGMAAAKKQAGDQPPLKKSTIKKGHEIAKSIEKEAIDVKTIQAAQSHSEKNPSEKDSESDANVKKPYGYRGPDGSEADDKVTKAKAKKQSVDTEAFKNKFSKMVEAKKSGKKKPDADNDGVPDWADKKPGEDDNTGKKPAGKKGMTAKQAKFFGKKNESVKATKKVVAESVFEAEEEGVEDLLAAVEEEINNPGGSVDNLRAVMNSTIDADQSPEFEKARDVINRYLDLVDNADVDYPSDDPDDDEPMIRGMKHGDIKRHIREYDLTDYLQHAAAMLEKVAGMGESYGFRESADKKKKYVKESVEPKLSFREMMKLVVESGGQQQMDPVDQTLFSWASRIAKNKLGEGMKAEIYAGLVYERMGGRFEMYDVLSENKK